MTTLKELDSLRRISVLHTTSSVPPLYISSSNSYTDRPSSKIMQPSLPSRRFLSIISIPEGSVIILSV